MTDKDATTEAELRAIFGHMDPVPQLLDDAARAAFGWRTVDAEIAELLRDSADATSEEEAGLLVRGAAGPRQLSLRVAADGHRARGRRRPARASAGWPGSCCRRRTRR